MTEKKPGVVGRILKSMRDDPDENHYHANEWNEHGDLICYEDGCRFYRGDEGEGCCARKECPYPDGPRIDRKGADE